MTVVEGNSMKFNDHFSPKVCHIQSALKLSRKWLIFRLVAYGRLLQSSRSAILVVKQTKHTSLFRLTSMEGNLSILVRSVSLCHQYYERHEKFLLSFLKCFSFCGTNMGGLFSFDFLRTANHFSTQFAKLKNAQESS